MRLFVSLGETLLINHRLPTGSNELTTSRPSGSAAVRIDRRPQRLPIDSQTACAVRALSSISPFGGNQA